MLTLLLLIWVFGKHMVDAMVIEDFILFLFFIKKIENTIKFNQKQRGIHQIIEHYTEKMELPLAIRNKRRAP